MARLQYKICTEVNKDRDGYADVHVYGRDIDEDGTPGEWHHITMRHTWMTSLAPGHGRRLKQLLRSLA